MADKKPEHVNYGRWFGVISVTGCLGFAIAVFALFIGLWLDSLIGQRGPATICLLVLSVPLNLYVMVKVAMMLNRYLRPLDDNTTFYDEEDD